MNETPIEIVEYDPAWQRRYEREADRIRAVLGERLIRIEHIGSTAVPGLASKPIIDLCPVVEDRETALESADLLEAEAGYAFGYDFEDDRIHLGRTSEGSQQFNLHLRWEDTLSGLIENLLLREYLRDHPEERDRYAEIKREAASRHPNDVEAYTHAKDEFVKEVLDRAREEGYEERVLTALTVDR